MPEQYWWPLVSQSRWFQGRGRNGSISEVHPLPWYTTPGMWPAIRSEVVVMAYPDGGKEYYHLLVGYLDDTDRGRDIADHPGLLRQLWQAWHGPGGQLSPHWITDLPADLEPHPFTGQQTHSSVTFGDSVQVKFFRRLAGNAEVGLLRTLAGRGARRVPRLYGSVAALIPGLGATDLAMIVEGVSARGDGWEEATEAASAGRSFASRARMIGADLHRLHTELSTGEDIVLLPGSTLIEELAESARSMADGPDTAHAAELIAAAAGQDWGAIPVQRVHADLHLGQCLDTDRGWVFVDFEGEPLRSIHNRRVHDSVWRDLAGMLRSCDYAAQTSSGATREWVQECRGAFLEGYGQSAEGTRLGRLYELEKAIYEVAYEQKHRPDWVHIPLGAVAGIGREVAAWAAPEQEWTWHTI